MKVIISSDYLYFFRDSPPQPNYLHTKIDLEELMDCRLASSKSSKPIHHSDSRIKYPIYHIPLKAYSVYTLAPKM